MSETTNHFRCKKCTLPCDIFVTYGVTASLCCNAPVEVVSSKDGGR